VPAPTEIFISYAHEDAEQKAALEQQLSFTKWSSDPPLVTWSDNQLILGNDWDAGIKNKLERADLVVFLLSSKLTNSDYIRDVEASIAFKRRAQNKCEILTVLLRSVVLDRTPFQYLQHVLANPVDHYEHSDDAWVQVARAIMEKVSDIRLQRPAEDEPPDSEGAGEVAAESLATVLAFPPKLEVVKLREAITEAGLSGDPSWAALVVRLSPLLRMLSAAARDEGLSAYQRGQCEQLRDALMPLTMPGAGGHKRFSLIQYAERRCSLALAALDPDL
jgi:TIR domain